MKSTVIFAAFLALGHIALGAEEAMFMVSSQEVTKRFMSDLMQNMPKVPKVLNPGHDGLPRMPPLKSVTALFEGAKKSVSAEAGRMAKQLKKMQEEDPVEIKKQRAALLMDLAEQEKKNQVYVVENQQLARQLLGMQKQSKALKTKITETTRDITYRREKLAKFSTKFQEAQKEADRTLASSALEQDSQDQPKDNEANEDSEDEPTTEANEDALYSLSFMEMGMTKRRKHHKRHAKPELKVKHVDDKPKHEDNKNEDELSILDFSQEDMPEPLQNKDKEQSEDESPPSAPQEVSLTSEKNQYQAAVHVDGLLKEDEDSLAELLQGVHSVKEQAKGAMQKIKDDYEMSYKVGVQRHEGLISQQKLLKKSQDSEESIIKKLKAQLWKLQQTSKDLDKAMSTQDSFLGTLKKTADKSLSLLSESSA